MNQSISNKIMKNKICHKSWFRHARKVAAFRPLPRNPAKFRFFGHLRSNSTWAAGSRRALVPKSPASEGAVNLRIIRCHLHSWICLNFFRLSFCLPRCLSDTCASKLSPRLTTSVYLSHFPSDQRFRGFWRGRNGLTTNFLAEQRKNWKTNSVPIFSILLAII